MLALHIFSCPLYLWKVLLYYLFLFSCHPERWFDGFLYSKICCSRQWRRYVHFWLSTLVKYLNFLRPSHSKYEGVCLSLSLFCHVLEEYIARLIIYKSHINLSDEALIRFSAIERFFVRIYILYLIHVLVLLFPGSLTAMLSRYIA